MLGDALGGIFCQLADDRALTGGEVERGAHGEGRKGRGERGEGRVAARARHRSPDGRGEREGGARSGRASRVVAPQRRRPDGDGMACIDGNTPREPYSAARDRFHVRRCQGRGSTSRRRSSRCSSPTPSRGPPSARWSWRPARAGWPGSVDTTPRRTPSFVESSSGSSGSSIQTRPRGGCLGARGHRSGPTSGGHLRRDPGEDGLRPAAAV